MRLHRIDFQPIGRRGQCQSNQTLLEAAHQLGLDFVGLCGGQGTCHRCKVQVVAGTLSPLTSNEKQFLSPQELEKGYRLACQTYPLGDSKLHVPPESFTALQRTQVEGLEIATTPEPLVRTYGLELSHPSLEDQRADAERVINAIDDQYQVRCRTIDLEVMRNLSSRLREWDWRIKASVRCDEIVALGPWHSRQLGIAIDLGTTKIAGYLLDLETGHTLAVQGIMNPQIAYGEDIIARLTRIRESPSEAARLQEVVIEALNQMTIDLCASVNAQPEEILGV